MQLCLIAVNPTDSVTDGFLPAARALGLDVTVLTDQPAEHRAAYAGHAAPPTEIVGCEVRDFREIIGQLSRIGRPDAIFSNSDHLQTQAALAAGYFGLPGKDWRVTLRCKNKALLRRHLPDVWATELPPGIDPDDVTSGAPPFPYVVKPREGVASEDVFLVHDVAELTARCREITRRRPGAALVVEEFVAGELRTLETLGDGANLWVLGGFRTGLSAPPYFVEEHMVFDPEPPAGEVAAVLGQLGALGVGFGACHTEYLVDTAGRVRLVEVNYRIIGDQCDLLLAELLGVPVFQQVLRVHLGESLPGPWRPRQDARARIEWVCADTGGTLTAAPPAGSWRQDGVLLRYRPLRAIGETRPKTNTNRDYLGVLRATGTSQSTVDRVAAGFRAANQWEIRG